MLQITLTNIYCLSNKVDESSEEEMNSADKNFIDDSNDDRHEIENEYKKARRIANSQPPVPLTINLRSASKEKKSQEQTKRVLKKKQHRKRLKSRKWKKQQSPTFEHQHKSNLSPLCLEDEFEQSTSDGKP